MKKLLIVVLVLFLTLSINVNAKDNKLYFVEEDNSLYYESGLIDEDFFMKHLEMMPGEESYTDELIIENGTNTDYTLYFKVVPKNNSNQNKLIENIIMKITLDGKLIYNGRATGLDYTGDGVNLQNAVELGKILPSNESKMVVETRLSKDYDNNGLANSDELSYVDWAFYARYGEEPEPILILENPETLRDKIPFILLIVFIIFLSIIGVNLYNSKNLRRKVL